MKKRNIVETSYEAFDFYLSNGEWFARLVFPRKALKALFPGARIRKGGVYLP